jgi:DNA-binding transcriptional MerR regulator
MLRIGEMVRIARVTPRLLHEAVSLPSPAVTNARTGYRYYDRAQVSVLQQILAYRDPGVPLAVIAELSRTPDLIRGRQRDAIMAKRAELNRQLAALEAQGSRPFRFKRTPPVWAASVRRRVEMHAAAHELLHLLRDDLAVNESTPSAAIWYECHRRGAPRLRSAEPTRHEVRAHGTRHRAPGDLSRDEALVTRGAVSCVRANARGIPERDHRGSIPGLVM